jgi:choice-of-anchor B domain-containing protein
MRSLVASLALAAAFAASAASVSAAPVPCVNGFAGAYPCDKVDMLARIPLTQMGGTASDTGGDVWGWTDPTTGKEYALVGLSNGTAFVDMSDPVNPIYLGRLPAPSSSGACVPSFGQAAPTFVETPDHEEECHDPGVDDDYSLRRRLSLSPLSAPTHCASNSLWRDIEVYADHAFIGSEQANHGLVVFDLRRLRGLTGPPVTFTENARSCVYGNSHTTSINTTTGFLYANGANSGPCGGGGKPIIMDIRTPASPVQAGCDTAGGYTHDSQCFVYQGPDTAHVGKSICINSNGSQSGNNRLNIDNVTNPATTVRLSSNSYSGAGYTHQGWVTADHRYFLLDDELDEENFGGNTRTYIWNITDLDVPVLVGTHFGSTPAIDHQQFIHGNFAYQSNYRAGLRILETKDITNTPATLTEVGFFDVYPPENITDYGGTWANYPFFHSGNVAISTIGPGFGVMPAEFFVLRPLFADLKATVTDAPDPVPAGQNVTYTFTVLNQGPTYSSNTTLVDALPANVTYVSATPSQGTCSGTSTVTCNLGRVEHDGSATVTIVARADVMGTITNAAVASSDENDTRLPDNTATAQTTVTQNAQAAEPAALTVDAAGNGVFQPNEGPVVVAPAWRNIGTSAITLSGAAAGFTGPAGPTYTTTDATAAYPGMAPGAVATCTDCYGFGVTAATRPAVHWDPTFVETVNPSASAKTWILHLGDSFTDVPATNGFYRFVETILHNGVTGGCAGASYCPAASTTREQMGVFALVSKQRAGYVPPPCSATPMFADVPPGSPYCRWIEELARRGVVSGCGGGNYCPQGAVNREQMAVFALKTLEGLSYVPPACTSAPYSDVSASSPFCPYIQELTVRGVVTGCGGGNYCPAEAVSREQMSVFLTVTFGLVLYGI